MSNENTGRTSGGLPQLKPAQSTKLSTMNLSLSTLLLLILFCSTRYCGRALLCILNLRGLSLKHLKHETSNDTAIVALSFSTLATCTH